MSQKRIRVGDVFAIPLSDDRRAYGRYVFKDKKMGPLIQVFDLITDGEVDSDQLISQLSDAQPLFPPVITGLFAAIRGGFWKVIGHMPVREFVYPKFVSTMHDEEYRVTSSWYLWDGDKSVQLGRELPEEYQHLEFLVVWDPHDIPHRIQTGENPYDRLKQKGCIPGREE